MTEVNNSQCKKIASVISKYKVRSNFLEREFLSIQLERETKLRAFFHAVAICHQTYSLSWASKNIFGWDVIEDVYVTMMKTDHELLKPKTYLANNRSKINHLLKENFSENGNANDCKFDAIEERAELLFDLEDWIQTNFNGSFTRLVEALENKAENYYRVLKDTSAFSDPLQKKTSFLLKLLLDADLIYIDDPANLSPIMDYHMQRVLLRTGCVIPERQTAFDLRNRTPLNSDDEIRSKCIEAIKIIADNSCHSVLAMNDFFWPHGRSCCNEEPVCKSHKCEKIPCSLSELIELDTDHSCVFEGVCPGKENEDFRQLWQPIVKTHFY